MPTRLLGNLPPNCAAVFEVAKPTVDINVALPGLHPSVKFSRADMEPAGFAWYLLIVNDQPAQRQWQVAADALRAVTQAGLDGRLSELRIIYGAHLLDLVGTSFIDDGVVDVPSSHRFTPDDGSAGEN